MADLDRLARALRAADAAGDTAAATKLAAAYRAAQAAKPEIPSGMVFDPRTGGYADMAAAAERAGPAMGLMGQFLEGVPFAGSFVDESMEVGSGAPPGMGQEFVRQLSKVTQRERPNQSMAARIAGGVAGAGAALAVPGVRALAGTVARNAPAALPAQAGYGAGLGAAGGATEGAIYGYGQGDDGNRGVSAAAGGVIGGGLGGIVGGAAPLAGRAVSGIAERLMDRPNRAALAGQGVTPQAAKVLQQAFDGDNPAIARQNIRAAGPDAMMVDAGPAARNLLDTSANASLGGARIAKDAIEGRAASSRDRLVQALDSTLGTPQGPKATARGIADSTRATRQQTYDAALNAPIDYASDQGRKVEDVIRRIPPKELKAAIDEANADMLSQGIRDRQIMAQIADDGSVSFSELPNMRQVDAIKRALQQRGQATDAFGRPTPEALRPGRLARELRDAAADAVPAYRDALAAGADKIGQDQGLRLGRDLLRTITTPEDVAEAVATAGPADLAAMRAGLRSHIDETMANVNRALSDTNMDAREAAKAFRDLSSRAAREKVGLILGPDDAGALFRQIDEAATGIDLRAAMNMNSKTAQRLAVTTAVDDAVKGGAGAEAMRGRLGATTQEIIQYITGRTKKADDALKQQIFADIARVLTEKRGIQAEQGMDAILAALQSRASNPARAAAIGRGVTGAIAVHGTPLAHQLLGTR